MIDATFLSMTRPATRLGVDAEREAAGEAAPAATAFDTLAEAFAREEPVLLAAARALTLQEAEARDLVQATFELALRHAGQLREPRKMRAWLLRIQAREAFRLQRRLRRFVRFEPEVVELRMTEPGATDDLAVRDALRRLPARTRAAVVLHHMAGLSVAEVADAMGTSQNTVKTQLRTGLARLREMIGDD